MGNKEVTAINDYWGKRKENGRKKIEGKRTQDNSVD